MQDWQNQILEREGFNKNETTKNTNIMKTQTQKATEPKEIVYRITIQEGAFVETTDYSFSRIFFNNKEEGDDYEFVYAIQSYHWEQLLKLELNESIFFSPDRNDSASKGIIVRVA